MMRFLSTANFTLLMAGTPGTVTAFLVPPQGALTTHVHSLTGPTCDDFRCNRTIDIYDLPKTFIQNLGTQDNSLAVRESSLSIRDTSQALRDPSPASADSTTTTTVTTPIVTLTMSCFGPSFTPVDGTTYHCSTTIPPPAVTNLSSISSISAGPTIISNGSPATTITSPESTLNIMPPPSITSARPFVTISNASTTVITPASDVTSSTVTINLTAFSNTTASISHIPTVTLTSLTTVDPPNQTNTITSGTSSGSSASSTDVPQSTGQNFKIRYNKFGVALIAGLALNIALAAAL